MRLGLGNGLKAAGTGGDCFLVFSGALGYMRVKAETGETVLLDGASCAAMAGDGTVMFYVSRDLKLMSLKPDQTEAEEIPVRLPAGARVQAVCPAPDGGAWMVQSVIRTEQPEINGRKTLTADVSFVLCGPDGAELRRVEAGALDARRVPDTLLVSDDTGVCLAFSPFAYQYPVWIFGADDGQAKVLLPKSLIPPVLRMGDREEGTDESGLLQPPARVLCPLGLSAGQKSLLLLDAESGYLLLLDLGTLQADVVMTDAQIMEVLSQKPLQMAGPMMLTNMFWNGTDLLCPRSTEGCVLRLPAAADGK